MSTGKYLNVLRECGQYAPRPASAGGLKYDQNGQYVQQVGPVWRCVCVFGGVAVQGGQAPVCTVDICNIFAGLLERERGP